MLTRSLSSAAAVPAGLDPAAMTWALRAGKPGDGVLEGGAPRQRVGDAVRGRRAELAAPARRRRDSNRQDHLALRGVPAAAPDRSPSVPALVPRPRPPPGAKPGRPWASATSRRATEGIVRSVAPAGAAADARVGLKAAHVGLQAQSAEVGAWRAMANSSRVTAEGQAQQQGRRHRQQRDHAHLGRGLLARGPGARDDLHLDRDCQTRRWSCARPPARACSRSNSARLDLARLSSARSLTSSPPALTTRFLASSMRRPMPSSRRAAVLASRSRPSTIFSTSALICRLSPASSALSCFMRGCAGNSVAESSAIWRSTRTRCSTMRGTSADFCTSGSVSPLPRGHHARGLSWHAPPPPRAPSRPWSARRSARPALAR